MQMFQSKARKPAGMGSLQARRASLRFLKNPAFRATSGFVRISNGNRNPLIVYQLYVNSYLNIKNYSKLSSAYT